MYISRIREINVGVGTTIEAVLLVEHSLYSLSISNLAHEYTSRREMLTAEHHEPYFLTGISLKTFAS